VDPTYLSKIENDRLEHTPSVRTIQAIAAAVRADEIELMELANKLPPVLEVFAREPEARRFLTASKSLRTAEDWRAATEFVERRVGTRSGHAATRRTEQAG
jgi:transcriptional regulator with XRE-family HTH domain